MTGPEISVVIVTYNSSDVIGRCLASLREHSPHDTVEVIVVDNASSDGTPDLIRRDFPWVLVFECGDNAGVSAGVNVGVSFSQGPYIATINPDCRFDADALTPLTAYLRDHPDVGIVAPQLLDDDGAVQLSCRAFPGYATALFSRYSPLTRLLPGNRFSRRYLMSGFDHASLRDVDWVSGAAMMFPRPVYDRLRGWDERFFLFSEDVDFCKRVHDAGLRVVYDPSVRVTHRIGISANPTSRVIVERHRSMWRYYRKHLRRNPPVDALTAAAIAARCALLLTTTAATRPLRRPPAP
ncbi:MAG: glycosyltransferase family 2 protein [Dehalococcoidia bacterium]